jgi:hypothetical protein
VIVDVKISNVKEILGRSEAGVEGFVTFCAFEQEALIQKKRAVCGDE